MFKLGSDVMLACVNCYKTKVYTGPVLDCIVMAKFNDGWIVNCAGDEFCSKSCMHAYESMLEDDDRGCNNN